MAHYKLKKIYTKASLYKVCSFSGGRSSGLMTVLFSLFHLDTFSEVIFCNTGFENESTLVFVNQFTTVFGIPITWLEYSGSHVSPKIVTFESASRNGEPFRQMCIDRQMLPNRVARFCTSDLKIKLIKRYLSEKGVSHYNAFIGIRADEEDRWMRLINTPVKDVFQYTFPLFDLRLTQKHVIDYWSSAPFDLKIPSQLGNCTLCFLKGKANLIRAMHLEDNHFAEFNQLEVDFNSTFSSRYSLNDLASLAIHQQSFFPLDFQDVSCHCNID